MGFNLTTKEQIALPKDVKMTSNGIVDRFIALGNMIDHLERAFVTSSSTLEVKKGFANDWGTVRYNVNQLMDACIEIGTEVNLRFARVADRLGRTKTHMTAVPGNFRLSTSRISPQKAKTAKASCISKYNDDESNSRI